MVCFALHKVSADYCEGCGQFDGPVLLQVLVVVLVLVFEFDAVGVDHADEVVAAQDQQLASVVRERAYRERFAVGGLRCAER